MTHPSHFPQRGKCSAPPPDLHICPPSPDLGLALWVPAGKGTPCSTKAAVWWMITTCVGWAAWSLCPVHESRSQCGDRLVTLSLVAEVLWAHIATFCPAETDRLTSALMFISFPVEMSVLPCIGDCIGNGSFASKTYIVCHNLEARDLKYCFSFVCLF